MSIAATVILFHPSSSVPGNIQSYSPFVDKVYIIDNSEETAETRVPGISRIPRCVYLHDGENKGIAARLNQACALAKADGYTHLLTMDQDSAFKTGDIKTYLTCIDAFPGKDRVAMFGVEFMEEHQLPGACQPQETEHLITSGSILNLAADAGGFDEHLFIDMVDTEYCYKSIIAGYKIIQFKNILLEHRLGTTVYKKSVKNLRYTPRNLHAPVRIYYIVRNYLYLKSKYGQRFGEDIARNRQSVLNRIKNNLLYNRQRLSVLKYIIRGITDFNRNRMGKINSLP